jgi:RNase P subunit RPR2
MPVQDTILSDRPMCKACEAPMRAARLELRAKQPSSGLQVFVCSECGLCQLVRPQISAKTAA